MIHWIDTLIDQQHFPFYEFMWLSMLGLWWSVINRLKRIEEKTEILNDNLNAGLDELT